MEAPQGVESTGTNRPSDLNTTHTHIERCVRVLCFAFTMRFPGHDREPFQPIRDPAQRFGGHSGGETPGPIPNPEVKPTSADGTAPGTVWESRTPPDNHTEKAHPRWAFSAPAVRQADHGAGDSGRVARTVRMVVGED